MINIRITPVHFILENSANNDKLLDLLKNSLSYKNKAAHYQYKKFLEKMSFYVFQYGEEWAKDTAEKMKGEIENRCYEVIGDDIYVLGGLFPVVEKLFNFGNIEFILSKPKINYKQVTLPWQKIPPELREWQKEALDKWNASTDKRGTVIAGTGSGKTNLVLEIIKRTGLKTIIVVPSSSILTQTYNVFTEYLGKKYIGKYSGSKKDSNKLITIATAQTLTRIDVNENPFKDIEFSIFDECDLMPAKTFEKVALGILNNAEYRLSVTGTWMRNDGADIKLRGITYDPIYTYDTKSGIEDGVLVRPTFYMLQYDTAYADINDRLRNLKKNVMDNKLINQAISRLCTKYVNDGKTTMILVSLEEHGQELQKIIPASLFISSADGSKDVQKAVDKLNNGTIKCLIATTVIGRGTDTKSVDVLFNLLCTASEPMNRQAIGRALRSAEGKTTSIIVDLLPKNNTMLNRHAHTRMNNIYKKLGEVKIINI